MPRSRPPYPPEFRQQMIDLVRSGRTPWELAHEFEPSAQTIVNWVAQADRDAGVRHDGPTSAEQDELRRLRQENKRLREEREILSKAGGLVRSGDRFCATEIFRFVEVNRAFHSVATMCRVLGVSPSGYYAWRTRVPSQREITDAVLTERIKALHKRSDGSYGAPRLHEDLKDENWRIGRKRVARLMRGAGIQGVSRRKGVFTTVRDEGRRGEPDLVERDFSADAPDELYVADITYIPTWSGFLYLAIVLDVFSRRVVGWAMATHLRTDLVLDALEMALWQRQPDGVIHHSDQGCQYTSIAFGTRCREKGVRPSMGSVGDCFDNAMAESFFATLECELLDRRRFRNPTEARLEVFRFIEGWYNPHRRHSAIGQMSPVNYERLHAERVHELKSEPVH
ncbi:IS3 family transposase [Aquisalimonas sp. APHAB1-3]|uniref:IS3 family transposase n=1 Tax=Aquisalimonas sp. APHAB1-3 TaxID=3402080 RepID=UPI003AADDE3F